MPDTSATRYPTAHPLNGGQIKRLLDPTDIAFIPGVTIDG
jgi:hypothetical protein